MAARDLFGRREFLTKMGFVAGAAAAVPAGFALLTPRLRRQGQGSVVSGEGVRAAEQLAAGEAQPVLSGADGVERFATPEEVRQLFGKLGPGTRLGRWTIVAVHDVRMGAIPVVLRGRDGSVFQVDVLRREEGLIATLGVANTPSLSFFLANGGNGHKRTVEEHGLGAMALAMVLERREAKGVRVPRLLTLRQRNSRFPNGDYGVVGGLAVA